MTRIEPWIGHRYRLWWIGRLIALAKVLQRASFALDAAANQRLDRIDTRRRSFIPYDAADEEVDAFFGALDELDGV